MANDKAYLNGIGTQFGNGQNTKLGGRKKLLSTIIKEHGYSKDDIKTAFIEVCFYTLNELKQVASDSKKPVIISIIASTFLTAYNTNDYKKIKSIIDYIL